MDGRIERRTLDNGLTVVAERRGLGPVVFSGVVYQVGSRDERPGLTGVSHLLEHMMFKGTEKYGKGDVAAIVERNGGELNAFTSEDVTMYYEVFARDRWELALEIEAERMVNLKVDAAELDSEREVVLEERAMYLDIPAVELSEELTAAVFRESPYRWPIIGWEADIRAITRDDMVEHYRKFYAPTNASLVVVGDVDADDVFAAAEKHFGAIPAGAAIDRRIPREPELKACTRLQMDRPVNLPQLQMLFRAPEIRTRDAEVTYLLANVLSGTRTSRLDMALLETHRAGDVHVQYHAKADPSTFTVLVEGHDDVPLETVEGIVWTELERLAENGPERAELDRALNQVEAHHVFALQSPSNRGFSLGWHEAHGDVNYADDLVGRLGTVTVEELQEMAGRMFRRDRCAIATIPAGRAGNRGGGGNGSAVESLNWMRSLSAGLPGSGPFGPGCPRRRFRTGLAASADTQRLTLDNGMRVILRADRTDPVVSVSLLFNGGAVLDPPGKAGLAMLAADTFERGTSTIGFPEFARRFENLGSDFSLAAGTELVHANSTFLARHTEAGLLLIADLLEDPGFAAEDLEVARHLALNDLAAREDDLDDVVDEMFFRGVAQGHPYDRLPHGTREGLESIDRDALVRFHAQAYRPDRAHLAIVGDFDRAAIDRVLARFGQLPIPDEEREEIPALDVTFVERTLVNTREDKAQVKIVFGGPGFSATDPDRLAGIAMNHVLGGSAIRSRLGDEIRDKRGLAYSVSSRNYERSSGGFFFAHMGTRPENVKPAVESIRSELNRITEGVTEQELSEAQAYLTGSFPLRFTTYGRLARFWARASFYDWPQDYLDTYVDRVRALTGSDLRRAAERLVGAAGTLAVAGAVNRDLEPIGSSRGDG